MFTGEAERTRNVSLSPEFCYLDWVHVDWKNQSQESYLRKLKESIQEINVSKLVGEVFPFFCCFKYFKVLNHKIKITTK